MKSLNKYFKLTQVNIEENFLSNIVPQNDKPKEVKKIIPQVNTQNNRDSKKILKKENDSLKKNKENKTNKSNFFTGNKKNEDSFFGKVLEKTKNLLSGYEDEYTNKQTPFIAKNLIKNTYGRFNKGIAKNISKITNNKTINDQDYSKIKKNFRFFYENFVKIMKENIQIPGFKFSNDYEGEMCANLIESKGDLETYIRKQYKNENINFNRKYMQNFYPKLLNIIQKIENDLAKNVVTVPTEIKKYSLLKGINFK